MWNSILSQCRQTFFPALCAACDASVRHAVFCEGCEATLEPASSQAKARSAYAYRGALADAMRKAKFHPDETRARALVPLFVDAYADEIAAFIAADAIAYVPSHWRRFVARGFEFPALLATGLAKRSGIPLLTCLRARTYVSPVAGRHHDAQERRARVQGRFVAARRSLGGARVILVDDVVSTGATLQECSDILVRAGAENVVCLTLAASS